MTDLEQQLSLTACFVMQAATTTSLDRAAADHVEPLPRQTKVPPPAGAWDVSAFSHSPTHHVAAAAVMTQLTSKESSEVRKVEKKTVLRSSLPVVSKQTKREAQKEDASMFLTALWPVDLEEACDLRLLVYVLAMQTLEWTMSATKAVVRAHLNSLSYLELPFGSQIHLARPSCRI